jgi:hypothetical protein
MTSMYDVSSNGLTSKETASVSSSPDKRSRCSIEMIAEIPQELRVRVGICRSCSSCLAMVPHLKGNRIRPCCRPNDGHPVSMYPVAVFIPAEPHHLLFLNDTVSPAVPNPCIFLPSTASSVTSSPYRILNSFNSLVALSESLSSCSSTNLSISV